MSNVVDYPDPIISAYRMAYRSYWGTEPPRVTKRTAKGYIIHGSAGDSRLISAKNMQRITRWLEEWMP